MNSNKGFEGIWIVPVVVGVLTFMILAMVNGAKNQAISLEESMSEAKSTIMVTEKREVDLIMKLVQVVEQASKYEQSTMLMVIEARKLASAGKVEEALTAINVVAEAYPQLKANETYVTLMTELSVSANLKNGARQNYNTYVGMYRKHVRTWPNSEFLSLSGYVVKNVEYLEYSTEKTKLPDQLFK